MNRIILFNEIFLETCLIYIFIKKISQCGSRLVYYYVKMISKIIFIDIPTLLNHFLRASIFNFTSITHNNVEYLMLIDANATTFITDWSKYFKCHTK